MRIISVGGVFVQKWIITQSCMCKTCEMEKDVKQIEEDNRGEDGDETN